MREVMGTAGERVESGVVTALATDARMVCIPRAAAVAQLVVAPDCGSGCRGFKPHQPPQNIEGTGPRHSPLRQEPIQKWPLAG